MSEENKAIVQRLFDEAWNQQKIDVVSELFSEDFVGEDPAFPNWEGIEGEKGIIRTVLHSFPDVKFTVELLLTDGDKVISRWRALGTHKADFNGIPPTNKDISITGNTIWRVQEGKIIEAWNNWDTLGLMQQIGAIPSQ